MQRIRLLWTRNADTAASATSLTQEYQEEIPPELCQEEPSSPFYAATTSSFMSVATTISGLIPATAATAATAVTAAAAQLPSWNATTAAISRIAGNTFSGGNNEGLVSTAATAKTMRKQISSLFVGGGGGNDAGAVLPTRSALSETENSSGGGMAELVGGFAKNVSAWASSGRVVATVPKVAVGFDGNSGNGGFNASTGEQTLHSQLYKHQQQQIYSQPIHLQFRQQTEQQQEYYQQHQQHQKQQHLQQQYFQQQQQQQQQQEFQQPQQFYYQHSQQEN
ncbi:hypothetical protein HK100_008912 [Physocladia obscura]|uniref:Uncharacterized protein n=1 Tax=Physocladia obscura TaxID=109957 RepID=A0AAD5T9N1_9FUNG|nr:hypothetical protein HK100_008912 [Physocladia obscura]